MFTSSGSREDTEFNRKSDKFINPVCTTITFYNNDVYK